MNHAATLSPAVPRPAPIPNVAVYDFDMFLDPPFLADPPEHGQSRGPLQQVFSPKAMLALKEDIRALVREHLSDPEPDPRKIMMKLLRITAMTRDTILERRERPQDDLITAAWDV